MWNGNILFFPVDIPSLNNLLWLEDPFNGAQFTYPGQTWTGKTRYPHHLNLSGRKQSHPAAKNIHQDPSHQSYPICWPSTRRLLNGPLPVPSGEGPAPTYHQTMPTLQSQIHCANYVPTMLVNTLLPPILPSLPLIYCHQQEYHHHPPASLSPQTPPVSIMTTLISLIYMMTSANSTWMKRK